MSDVDQFFVVSKEEYAFVRQNYNIPSTSIVNSVISIRCPEYAKLRQTKLMKLLYK